MEIDMDSPRPIFDDEVIADSEEEPMDHREDFFPELGNGGSLQLNRTSSVSTFTALGHPHPETVSGISTFSENLRSPQDHLARVSSIETAAMDNGKGKAADTSIRGSFTDFEGISGAVSIADRAKMRQRSQKQPPPSIIEIPSDEEYEVILKPSTSKGKSKAKAKPKPKAKEIATEKESASTVYQPTPEAPPRPRPRPHFKRPKTTHDGIGVVPIPGVDHYPPTSTSPPPSRSNEIPVATSTPAPPMGQRQWRSDVGQPDSSPLPPSDPPGPSMSTTYNENIPRIETLPDQDYTGQPSSPSSLFSERTSRKKRKRGPMDVDTEIDQLETSQNAAPVTFGDVTAMRFYKGPGYVSPRNMPPPGTFFASSSQSSIGDGRDKGNPAPGSIPQAEPTPHHEIVDLTMFPTMDPSITVKTSASKPEKPRKHRVTVEDEDPMPPPMIVLDDDERDEDFNPRGDGEMKKKKKKAKATPKEKNPSSSKSTSKTKVEVVITTKPPRKGKNKEKSTPTTKPQSNKDKGKGDKETFKSAEFIEDSDDDADPLRLVEGAGTVPGEAPISTSTVAKSKEGVTGSTSSPIPPSALSPFPKSSSLKANQPKDTPASVSNSHIDSDMPKASSSTRKRASGTAKRKAVLDSDEEQEPAEDDEVVVVLSSSTSKKKQANEKKNITRVKSKVKNVIMSDAEENEAYDDKVDDEDEGSVETKGKGKEKEKAPKKAKVVKKIIPDKDDEEPQDVSGDIQQKQQSMPDEMTDVTKENIEPASKAINATPKPPNNSKAAVTNSTPLYERYEVAPRKSSLPMSELIRRANSMPGSPFPAAPPSSSKLKSLTGRTPSSTAYSPYLKSSRSLLSRIAPLHPNRRTPPPPPPPPPPRKKTKKELELEEKWEEELVENVGVEAWAVMQDEERKELRKAKWAKELGDWDD